jgi:hypothetical protein
MFEQVFGMNSHVGLNVHVARENDTRIFLNENATASRSDSQWRCWRIISKVVFWTAVVSFLSVMDNPAAAISTRMQETMTARKSLSMTANAGHVRSFLDVSGERFALCLTKRGRPRPPKSSSRMFHRPIGRREAAPARSRAAAYSLTHGALKQRL